MNYTENLTLKKPAYGDNADVADLNYNADILDSYCYNTRQMECEPYDSTKTYMSGDLAIHNEVIYECNTDNTTGAWDDSKWDNTNLAEQIAKAKQSGGGQVTKEASGNPIELTDAASAPMVKCVTEIQGSQDLHGYSKPWVGGSGKNKLPMTVSEIKALNTNGTWSGDTYTYNNITFTIETDGDGNVTGILIQGTTTGYPYFDFPVVTLKQGTYIFSMGARYRIFDNATSTQIADTINPYTLQVTDSSHEYKVRIFTGNVTNMDVTALPLVRLSTESADFAPYSNICPITAYTEGEIEVRGKNLFDKDNVNNITAYVTANSGLLEAGSTEHSIYLYLEQGTYTVQRIIPSSDTTTKRFRFRLFRNVPQIGETGDVLYDGLTELTATITLPYSGYLLIFMFNGDSAWNARQEVFNSMQIEKGSTATTYEPYTSTTHTTTYPSAIYRGSEDVVNGEVTSDNKYMEFSGSASESWVMTTGEGYHQFYIVDSDAVSNSNMLCNMFELITTSERGSKSGLVYNNDSYFRVSLLDTMGITTVEQWKTFLSNNNLQIVADRITPTTSSVTTTNLPIKSLSGYNHIESSTGEMEVEYITEEYQPLVDLIQSSNRHIYSTQEQVVGKWTDGRDLYERIIEFPNVTINGGPADFKYKGDLMIKSIIPNADIILPDLQHSYYVVNSAQFSFLGFHVNCNTGELTVVTLFTVTNADLHIYLQYTKTPSSTRSLNTSLNTQKAQIEPLTEKEEEVPTEEEKAVNEEENTNENR